MPISVSSGHLLSRSSLTASAFLLLWTFLCIDLPAAPREPSRTLSILLIQLQVDDHTCSSRASFEAHTTDTVVRALEAVEDVADSPGSTAARVDLIVFPEYTSALHRIAAAYGDAIVESDTFAEAVAYLSSTNSRRMARLLARLPRNRPDPTDTYWSVLATRFGVTIVAGTDFAVDRVTGELRNRMLVYDKTGASIYYQDKVYLTPFEQEILGLSPGHIEDAAMLPIRGYDLAFTICRDTFFDAWESRFQDAAIWIDLKANGASYTQAMAHRFETAVPERIAETGVPLGITLCLTGELLDLFWEGRSSIVREKEPESFTTVWKTDTATEAAAALMEAKREAAQVPAVSGNLQCTVLPLDL